MGLGRVDLGITGHDQVKESRTTEVEQILDLGFGKCKLQVQVPQKGAISDPSDLVGKNVVTSFVQLTREYFEKLEVDTGREEAKGSTKIQYVGGSVEAACALGVADGIVDLVGQLYTVLTNPAPPPWFFFFFFFLLPDTPSLPVGNDMNAKEFVLAWLGKGGI